MERQLQGSLPYDMNYEGSIINLHILFNMLHGFSQVYS